MSWKVIFYIKGEFDQDYYKEELTTYPEGAKQEVKENCPTGWELV